MAILGHKSESEQPPVGNTQGVLAFIEDIGYQESDYMGQKMVNPQVIFIFELNECKKDMSPFLVMKFYNLLIGKKANLRKDVEGWIGKQFTTEEIENFDFETLIGKNCLLSMKQNSKGNVVVGGISALPRGMAEMKRSVKSLPAEMEKWITEKKAKQVEKPSVEVKEESANSANGSGLPF